MFATPCYGLATTSPFSASAWTLAGDLGKLGVDNRIEFISESLVPRARNRLLALFLADKTWTHLFWLDADIHFKTEAVLRLMLADKDVAVGVYPLKQFNWPADGIPAGMTQQKFEELYSTYCFSPLDEEADVDGFCRVYKATSGFMCVKRQVFEKLQEHYPELRYRPDPPHPDDALHWAFFDTMISPVSRHYLSEDYGFCQLWYDMNGDIHADVHSKLWHAGQHIWHGDLFAHLQSKANAPRSLN